MVWSKVKRALEYMNKSCDMERGARGNYRISAIGQKGEDGARKREGRQKKGDEVGNKKCNRGRGRKRMM